MCQKLTSYAYQPYFPQVRLQSSDASEHVKQESYLPGRFKDIFAREGVRGLYRGAGPTTLRGALVAGAQGGGWIDIDLILLPCRFGEI